MNSKKYWHPKVLWSNELERFFIYIISKDAEIKGKSKRNEKVEKPSSEKVEKTTKKDKSEVQEKKTEKKEIPDKIGKISEKPLLKPEMTESNFSFQGSSATKEVKKKTGFAPTNDEMRDSAKNVAVRALSKP